MQAAVTNPVSHRSLDQLESDIVSRVARMNAEEYQFLCDVREFDIRQGWKAYHFNNCAEWVSWKCQMVYGTAREKVRVANCLFWLPVISKAFQEGRLSYSQVRPLTRVANEHNEQDLLDYASRRTADQVERYCRRLRNAEHGDSTDDANRVYQARALRKFVRDDGSMVINVELPQEMGEIVMKAVEIAMTETCIDDHDTDSDRDSFLARQADALVNVAKQHLEGGSTQTARRGDDYTVTVHVDESALAGRGGESDLPIETVRRIACDSNVLALVKGKHDNPLSVGRKTRAVPLAIRRALAARDGNCRFPGCTHTKFLEPHHVMHWVDGGETKLENLVLLCSRHHRLHHEGGYTIHAHSDGYFVFRNSDGKVIPDAPPWRAEADAADPFTASRDAVMEEPPAPYFRPGRGIPSPAFWPASSRHRPAHPVHA